LCLDLEQIGEGSVRVRVRGELDLSTSPALGETLGHEITDGKSVVVDLSGVTFIDGSALNTLIRALLLCEANGGRLRLSPDLPAVVSRVFHITGLEALLPIEPD
jgi:anti-sigma B factor antagonist